MPLPVVLVTHQPPEPIRDAFLGVLADTAEVLFLPDLSEASRRDALQRARAVLTYHPIRDLGADAFDQLENCGLMQCLTAGIDYLPFGDLPDHIAVAYNAGAYAEPMAEHVAAMALSASKRLAGEHRLMKQGEFNQFVPTKRIAGATCGILGYGETGREVARLMRALGMNIQAINRTGRTDEPVDFIGTLDEVDRVLAASDVVVITLALTKKTDLLIRAAQLACMKTDAILINVARGEIVDEDDLYAHLIAHPEFTACLEAWWIEPIRHGRFETAHPFLDLSNVIASPHNSAMTDGALITAARRGAENVLRFLNGQTPKFIAGDDVRMA
ncbi:MAG: phosphoglycerate dehydrogenase-like enzyme [Paracoccaceae bacterium]|jgi:phosphoglycerate dehydrogenase-like enzyme